MLVSFLSLSGLVIALWTELLTASDEPTALSQVCFVAARARGTSVAKRFNFHFKASDAE